MNKEIEKEFAKGTLLKKLREEFGFSQKELAQRLGCSQQTINRYEGGYITPPLERVKKLSEIFNVDKYYFLPDEWQPPYTNGMPKKELLEILEIIEGVLKAKKRDILLEQKIELAYIFFNDLKSKPNISKIDKVIYINDYFNKDLAVNQ